MQNRKVSLESVETATSSSSWKSGQKSDGQNSEGQKYKTEVLFGLFSYVDSGEITITVPLDSRYNFSKEVFFCSWI
jgi:hypothetical protein